MDSTRHTEVIGGASYSSLSLVLLPAQEQIGLTAFYTGSFAKNERICSLISLAESEWSDWRLEVLPLGCSSRRSRRCFDCVMFAFDGATRAETGEANLLLRDIIVVLSIECATAA